MSPPPERVAVLGAGLLGGSVAAAAKTWGAAREVVAYDRDPTQVEALQARGFADRRATDAAEACRGADLVVLATPVAAMEALAGEAAPGLSADAVVTDVGSVKAPLARSLPAVLPAGVAYVGSHPMAGGHRTGAAAASAELFSGAVVVVTGDASPARDRVVDFWKQVRADVEFRSPGEHDLEVAWTSHLPHVLAFAFAGALAEAPAGAKRLVGAGFRDFTRIARGDAALWAGILSANRAALLGPLAKSAAMLRELADALDSADGTRLETILAEASAQLNDFPES